MCSLERERKEKGDNLSNIFASVVGGLSLSSFLTLVETRPALSQFESLEIRRSASFMKFGGLSSSKNVKRVGRETRF